MSNQKPRIAIVHDFLFQYGGAEKVVEKWLAMYPEAEIYTSFFVPEKFASSTTITQAAKDGRIYTTWINNFFNYKFRGGKILTRFQKHLFWLYPLLMRMVTLRGFDLVLISSTDCAKQVTIKPDRSGVLPKIIHYCHSPTRYLNGLTTETEHQSLPLLMRIVIPFFILWLRPLDLNAVKRLNSWNCVWVANSKYIQGLISSVYQTDSVVIYPPTETETFGKIIRTLCVEDFYLCHGRISFHKRIDLAILACLQLGRKLKISGISALDKQMQDLQKLVDDAVAIDSTKEGLIEFLGRTTDDQAFELIAGARAFLFPGKEDFGISPIEMLAAGVPLIAYQAGGALEYVKDGVNGVFFENQTVEDLVEAILRFETLPKFDEQAIRGSSKAFGSQPFEMAIRKLIG